MPRSRRRLLSQSYYHIMTRGNNRNTIFRGDEDYQKYLDLVMRYKEDHPFDLLHYCLMPNHTHFLIKTNKASHFSTFMKKLNLSYYYYYKKRYSWVGHFFQGRFKSQPVGKDDYFIQCGKYIELNPVRAGFVKNPGEYPYSSYNYYAKGFNDTLITEDFVYQELNGSLQSKQRKYQDIVTDELIESTYTKVIWGTPKQRYNEARKIKNHL